MSFLRTVLNNSVIIHPPGFYIIGFQSFPYISVYIIFLAFVYVVTLVFNSLLIYIIACDRCLHTPKCLAVVNLAVTDIFLNTSTIPSMIKTFLFKDNFIPFNLCLLQMYVYYAFASLESFCYIVHFVILDWIIIYLLIGHFPYFYHKVSITRCLPVFLPHSICCAKAKMIKVFHFNSCYTFREKESEVIMNHTVSQGLSGIPSSPVEKKTIVETLKYRY